jgi:hypothetical protein
MADLTVAIIRLSNRSLTGVAPSSVRLWPTNLSPRWTLHAAPISVRGFHFVLGLVNTAWHDPWHLLWRLPCKAGRTHLGGFMNELHRSCMLCHPGSVISIPACPGRCLSVITVLQSSSWRFQLRSTVLAYGFLPSAWDASLLHREHPDASEHEQTLSPATLIHRQGFGPSCSRWAQFFDRARFPEASTGSSWSL